MNRIILEKEFQQIINYLLHNQIPINLSKIALNTWKKEWQNAKYFKINNNYEIYIQGKKIIPYEQITKLLLSEWKNPQYGGTGIQRFYDKIKQKYFGITKQEIIKFLNNLEPYQLHKRVIRADTVNPIVPKEPKQYYQIDLIDMSKYKTKNSNYSWILTIIDLFTKKAYATKLKNKEGETITNAVKDWLNQEQLSPKVLQSDRGGEFNNQNLKLLLQQRNIRQQLSLAHSPESQGGIERFNGTLKREINMYFTTNGNTKWIDVLPRLIKNYNNSIHAITKMRPNIASNHSQTVLNRLQQNAIKQLNKTPKYTELNIGDTVRIALQTTTEYRKDTFRKKYLNQWSTEIYKISNLIQPPPLGSRKFIIKDANNNLIKRKYFRFQLQKININQLIKTIQQNNQITQQKQIIQQNQRPIRNIQLSTKTFNQNFYF